jgi:hypothetical protein
VLLSTFDLHTNCDKSFLSFQRHPRNGSTFG